MPKQTRSQVGNTQISSDREREIEDLFTMETPPASVVRDAVASGQIAAGQIFDTAAGDGRQKFPPLPEPQRGFDSIIRDLFQEGLDVMEEYKAIKESLSIKGALTPLVIQSAANNTEQMADRAFRLYVVAVNEYEAYMREIGVIEAALRDSATAHLEREKADKTRTKMITEADVIATISQCFPDEWSDVQSRKSSAKGMLDYLSNLADLAKKRCFSVSRMLRD
jgi:hypothetical protein